ncbi:hypothetical protein IMZ48_22410 [Candidatus Bathyarchaeota archaeon]|nr:hypothetical protein [Candidatus Bathyarchaeota archaeon]
MQKFCWVLLMGCSWEVGSFALRAAGSRDQQQMTYNVVSQILLLLAPLCKSSPPPPKPDTNIKTHGD